MKTNPPAVAMEPPRFGEPVSMFSPSTTPSGTFQTISPLFTSTCIQCSPWRLLAWPLILVPEAGILALFGATPIRHGRPCWLRLHCAHRSQLIDVYEQISQ